MKYKFLDVGCKIGGSFGVSKKFGYTPSEGLGIDVNESHVENFKKTGHDAVIGDATNLNFEDNSFELTIFNHVIEHLPNNDLGFQALDECLRVSSKYVYLSLPFFDEDEYLNLLNLKTFYSDWAGHTNMVHLKTILNHIKNYDYELNMVIKLTDSNAKEILPLSTPIDSMEYNELIHGEKPYIVFDRDIWREYNIIIKK